MAVTAGRPERVAGAPVNPPVELSATFEMGGAVTYGREDNQTWRAFEHAVGALEGGEAVAFASGLAAVAAVVETLPVGARISVPPAAYGGVRRFLADRAEAGRFVVVGPGERAELVWAESVSNPTMEVADVPGLVAAASPAPVVVDNTMASPLLRRPLDEGAAVVVHSATKLLSGHSDVVLGVAVSRDPRWVEALRRRRSLHGAVPGPFEAWLALRGLRTLAVRLDRSCRSAAVLAERLASHPAVSSVRYPGFGPVLSFEVAGGAAAATAVEERVRLVVPGTSLGGVESLIERRAKWDGEDVVPPGLLRLSVGIEHVEDVWRDLDAALSAASP